MKNYLQFISESATYSENTLSLRYYKSYNGDIGYYLLISGELGEHHNLKHSHSKYYEIEGFKKLRYSKSGYDFYSFTLLFKLQPVEYSGEMYTYYVDGNCGDFSVITQYKKNFIGIKALDQIYCQVINYFYPFTKNYKYLIKNLKEKKSFKDLIFENLDITLDYIRNNHKNLKYYHIPKFLLSDDILNSVDEELYKILYDFSIKYLSDEYGF